MKFLITGGEGFIGRNIKQQLELKEHEVFTLDIVGKPDFVSNIMDFESLFESFKGMDGIFHMSAITSPPQFEDDLFTGFDVNVRGTLNVLKAASQNKVKRVVTASSSSVYGNLTVAGKEDMEIPAHENMYSTTKLFDEYLCKFFSVRKEIETVSLRFFNTYGLGENSKGMYSSVISKFLESIKGGESPVIYGDGSQRRDFVYVKDVAMATILAMDKGISGETYNVGTGVAITFNEIIDIIREVLGKYIVPRNVPNPFKNYQLFTLANTIKTTRELGWTAQTTIQEGVSHMAKNLGLV